MVSAYRDPTYVVRPFRSRCPWKGDHAMQKFVTKNQQALRYVKKWGEPMEEIGYPDRMRHAINVCRQGLHPAWYEIVGPTEWITLVLGLGRHDLLPKICKDPSAAWMRLDTTQKRIVRDAIGCAPWMTD